MADQKLISIVERIEAAEAEKREIAETIRAIYAEAKSAGYDVKVLRTIIRERQVSFLERAERERLLDTYRAALGMLADTPLGEAALRNA